MGAFDEVTLGIVCPIANERATATRFVGEVLEQCRGFRRVTFFAVLDRASVDGTRGLLAELAEHEPRLRIVWAPENRNVVDAYLRGYREALAAGCDWILEIDAGYSHQPSDIPQFFTTMARGHDCVFGARFGNGAGSIDGPLGRRLLSRGGSLAANWVADTAFNDMTSGFQLFSRAALEAVLRRGIRSRAHFFQTEIKSACRDLCVAEVPIHYQGPSPAVDGRVLLDAAVGLVRLAWLRLAGQLWR